jgi:hypothetical protein
MAPEHEHACARRLYDVFKLRSNKSYIDNNTANMGKTSNESLRDTFVAIGEKIMGAMVTLKPRARDYARGTRAPEQHC